MKTVMEKFSVLLSIYKKEKPEFLRASLESVFEQTRHPDEVVLIEDGPLTPELYDVILSFSERFPSMRIIAFENNRGLGNALRDGVNYCSYELIARMDTDDISKPTRFEKQLEVFRNNPETDVCGAWVDEFEGAPENVVCVRKLPEMHNELFMFGKKRNPVNHPVCMFRKSAVVNAGNYIEIPLFEDYYLWARMMKDGYHFYCIQESLLLFRRSPDMIRRRGGLAYAKVEARFQKVLHELKYISFCRMISNILIRFIIRIIPVTLRSWLYIKIRK